MYKLKLNKGVTLHVKSLGIVLKGDEEYTQEELKKYYDLGLTSFVEKVEEKKKEDAVSKKSKK